MPFEILLSPEAIADINDGFEYYNSKSIGLGFEFTDTIDIYFSKISEMPTASSVRYDNVRVKPISTFPYSIHFVIDEPESNVIILRIFNNWQKPFWEIE